MKGITHFLGALAAASCIPSVVRAAMDGNPWYFVIAGVCGVLPDTCDFRFSRFLARHDLEVQPDPAAPDAALIAGAMATAVHRALASGRPVRVKFNTVPVGPDRWRRYTIHLDVAARRIRAEIGPVVNTSRQVADPGSPDPFRGQSADTAVAADMHLDYFAVTEIDIFDGPLFELAPGKGRSVSFQFIPWHRRWSHSLTLAAGLGLLAAVWDPLAGLTAGLGMLVHIVEDQMGFLGSNLFYPFTRTRQPGLQRWHADDPRVNAGFSWASVLVIFWNLARATPPPELPFNAVQFFFLFLGVPLLLLQGLPRLLRRRA